MFNSATTIIYVPIDFYDDVTHGMAYVIIWLADVGWVEPV